MPATRSRRSTPSKDIFPSWRSRSRCRRSRGRSVRCWTARRPDGWTARRGGDEEEDPSCGARATKDLLNVQWVLRCAQEGSILSQLPTYPPRPPPPLDHDTCVRVYYPSRQGGDDAGE